MVWKASDGPVPLARALKGSGVMFLIFPSKAPFTEFVRLEKRCEGMI